jgi:hypothetical protein
VAARGARRSSRRCRSLASRVTQSRAAILVSTPAAMTRSTRHSRRWSGGALGHLSSLPIRFSPASEQLAALVLRYALPVISAHREFTMAGGLFSYGTSLQPDAALDLGPRHGSGNRETRSSTWQVGADRGIAPAVPQVVDEKNRVLSSRRRRDDRVPVGVRCRQPLCQTLAVHEAAYGCPISIVSAWLQRKPASPFAWT